MTRTRASIAFSERRTEAFGTRREVARRNVCRFLSPAHEALSQPAPQQALVVKEASQSLTVEVSAKKLDDLLEKGRAGLLAVSEKNGVPMPRSGEGPYRQAPLNMELLVYQMERAGLMDSKGISETAVAMLDSENPSQRQAGADILGSIVLDSDIHRGYTRMGALMALVSKSSCSDESRGVLMQFGFTRTKIEAMERLWAEKEPPKMTVAEIKSSAKKGVLMSAIPVAMLAVASNSAPGTVMAAACGVMCSMVIDKLLKLRKWIRTTRKAQAELPFKAIEEVDTFRRLLEPKKEFVAARDTTRLIGMGDYLARNPPNGGAAA